MGWLPAREIVCYVLFPSDRNMIKLYIFKKKEQHFLTNKTFYSHHFIYMFLCPSHLLLNNIQLATMHFQVFTSIAFYFFISFHLCN